MFYCCTSLTTAPQLLATTLVDGCYSRMFYNCTKLNLITMLATNPNSSSLSEWLYGVSPTGTFYKNKALEYFSRGASGIPNGWKVKNYGEE